MKCVIMDEETIALIRSALVVAKRHNIRSAKTALIRMDGPTLLDSITDRMDSLSTTDSDAYVYLDELNRLRDLQQSIESGQTAAEDYLLIKSHIRPGQYCATLNRQMHQLLDAGHTEFMLPDDDAIEKMEDMELAKIPVKHIRAARALLGWTQKELANKAGAAVSTVAEFERGEHEPKVRIRRAVVNTLKEAGVSFTSGGVEVDEGN